MKYPVSDYTQNELSKLGNCLERNWFEGDQISPEIESLEEISISNEEMFNEYVEDSDNNIYESDESDNDSGSDYAHFWFKNHLKELIISYSVTLYFLLLFTWFFIMIKWFFKDLRVRKNLRTVTRGVCRSLATSKMELFVTLVNGFVLSTNVLKNSVSDVARVLDKSVVAIHRFFNHE